MKTFIERATPLLERGLSVIPIKPRDKAPIYGVTHRTQNAEVVAAWAAQFPEANVGVTADEHTVILDADDAAALVAKTGPLHTYTVESSPGKAHYYFRRDGFTVRNLELGNLGSLRAENMYVVGAGSIHPKTGLPYRVVNDVPLASMGQGLYRHLESLADEATREINRVILQWDGKEKIGEGSRQYFLRSQAGKLWDGARTEEEMFAALQELNQKFCDPPKSDGELSRLVTWVMQKEPNTKGPAVTFSQERPMEKPETLIKTISALRKAAQESHATPYLIHEFIPASQPHIMPGDSGLGKSPLVGQMLVSLALGKEFLGAAETKPRKVLMVDYENGPQVLNILDTICRFLGRDPGELESWLGVLDGNDCGAVDVMNAADRWGAELITVDALRGFNPLAESKNDHAAEMLKELQKHGAAWLLVHHLRKDPAQEQAKRKPLDREDVRVLEWLNAASGARALINQTHARLAIDEARTGTADLIIRPFVKGIGETGRVYINRVFDEDGEPVGYERATGTGLLSLNHKHWFSRVEGQSLTYGEIERQLDLSRSTIAAFLKECAQARLVEKIPGAGFDGGKNKPRYRFGELPNSVDSVDSARTVR